MSALADRKIRVAVACDNDPADPRAYSGTLASVLEVVATIEGVEVVATIDCSAAPRRARAAGPWTQERNRARA